MKLPTLTAMIVITCAGCDRSGDAPTPEAAPTTSLKALFRGSPGLSRDDLLEVFQDMPLPDEAAVSAAIDSMVTQPGVSVSHLHMAWSTESEIRQREFADFILAWQRAHPESPLTFHFINSSAITHDYRPLHAIPGWETGKHSVGGYGEILWMKEGRLVDFEKISSFASTEALVEKAESLMK